MMEINWRSIPFVRPLLGLIAGILSVELWPGPWALQWSFYPAAVFLVFAFYVLRKRVYENRWQFGLCMLLFFFFTGAYHRAFYPDESKADFLGKLSAGSEDALLVELIEPPRLTTSGKSRRVLCRCVAINERPCRGKLLIYLSVSDSLRLRAGDLLLMPAAFEEIPPPANPYAFDYRAYMKAKQIHFRAFVRNGGYMLVGHVHRLWYSVLAFRQKLLDVLPKYLQDENARAVVSAMVLGERKQMSRELKDLYAQTGAMHVLAVSGLHMGLIYFFLIWIFDKAFPSMRSYRGLRFLSGLVGLWSFALLTGASPSVLRAATLFSFLLAGKWIDERPNTFNSLAASAFCLLWYNPLWLKDLSFQLSYAALLGILLLRRDIYLLWLPDRLPLLRAWKLTSVSIAAQISTAPLGMYYFHRFSNGFWLSSLLVVPAAPFILLGGLLLLLLDGLSPALAAHLGVALEYFVLGINRMLQVIAHLPGQCIDGIFLNMPQLLLLYLAVVFWALAFKSRQGRYLLYGMALLLGVQVISGFRQIRQKHHPLWVAYEMKRGQFLLDAIAGGERLTIYNHPPLPREESFVAEGLRRRFGVVEKGEVINLAQAENNELRLQQMAWHKPFLQIGDELLLFLDANHALPEDPFELGIDTLFLLK